MLLLPEHLADLRCFHVYVGYVREWVLVLIKIFLKDWEYLVSAIRQIKKFDGNG